MKGLRRNRTALERAVLVHETGHFALASLIHASGEVSLQKYPSRITLKEHPLSVLRPLLPSSVTVRGRGIENVSTELVKLHSIPFRVRMKLISPIGISLYRKLDSDQIGIPNALISLAGIAFEQMRVDGRTFSTEWIVNHIVKTWGEDEDDISETITHIRSCRGDTSPDEVVRIFGELLNILINFFPNHPELMDAYLDFVNSNQDRFDPELVHKSSLDLARSGFGHQLDQALLEIDRVVEQAKTVLFNS